MRSINIIKNHKIKILIIVVVVILGYLYVQRDSPDIIASLAVVVEQVERGEVTSGIETTGEIVAAQKLDLDVYKQITRIEAVNVLNGGKVNAGDVLLAFDTSDAFVEVGSSQVSVAEAELILENERLNYADPNIAIRTLENDIFELETVIKQAGQDKNRAYRTYLNTDTEAVPGNKHTQDKVRPVVTGLYFATVAGEYSVDVYRSGSDSNYSYRVSGLESATEPVLIGFPTIVGSSGLEITFPTTVRSNDSWIIAVPNIYAAEYVENRENYEETLTNLNLLITESRLAIANKTEEISDLRQTDSSDFRDLGVARAQASLAEAREQLSQNFDVVQEQNIVAPFSGTVEGMENVVVGASPTRDTNDPITLGTLISDDFLVTFSLSAVDVAKVEVGQLVLANVTSFPEAPTLEAFITEISSLPNSDGVAQYEVQAFIMLPENLPIRLREGLLADIEIVEEVATDVLRAPSAAINYTNRQAQVRVIEDITPEQQETIDSLSVIKIEADQQPGYFVDVEIGVTGSFYSEIISGLTEGQYLIVGDVSETESALQEGGTRGGRPRNDS
jgi:multidrug efflux pump subunit AcrA (membrane-fusion protein)